MNEKKDYKVEFAPGCFDNFEGTQEELDDMIAEIRSMFSNKTAEEIEAMSRPVSHDDFEDLPDEVKEQLAHSILDAFGDLEDELQTTRNRKLQ